MKEELPEKYDVIVPCHFPDWNFFSDNIKSWFDEIPVRKLLFGCNNSDEKQVNTIKQYLSQYEDVEFIDQRKIKTLGMQLADLMMRVETPWFVYCHADARPTRHSFLVLKAETNKKTGIVESERVSYKYENPKSYPTVYPARFFIPRSFSGYQLIRKKAIGSVLPYIEDDYIYRNEDIIFQNVCEDNGYDYIKSFGMHIHTNSKINWKWTPQGKESKDARKITFDMQIKGIVKYCTPNDITIKAFKDAFSVCYRDYNLDLFDFLENFVKKVNILWVKPIKNLIMRAIR